MTVGVRDPGYLPNVLARVEAARRLLRKNDLAENVRVMVEGILALATTQHELNKRLWEGTKGFAEPHADTHKGDGDSVAGLVLPEPIEAGDTGAIGDPALGMAPIGHEHAVPTGIPADLGNVLAEGSSLSLPRLDHVHKILARGKLNGVDVAIRNALDFRDNTIFTWTISDDPGNDELDILGGLSNEYKTAPAGATVKNATGLLVDDAICFIAPYACDVISVKAIRRDGTGATVNMRRNFTSEHLSSDLSVVAVDTLYDGGAIQNASYAINDIMEARVKSVAGSPTHMSIVAYVRRTG